MLLLLPTKRGRWEVPELRPKRGSLLSCEAAFAFTAPVSLENSMTRTHVRLLGPCFKTGRRGHRPTRHRDANRVSKDTRYTSPLKYPPSTKLGKKGSNTRNELHLQPKSGNRGSWREENEKCNQPKETRKGEGIAAQTPKNEPKDSLNLELRLREPLRLPLHSFTYS